MGIFDRFKRNKKQALPPPETEEDGDELFEAQLRMNEALEAQWEAQEAAEEGWEEGADQLIDVRERCGVMLNLGKDRWVWIVLPFWDTSDPVRINSPEREVAATIVLNQHVEGCLPLSSFLAADQRIEADALFKINPDQPHDWHPTYKSLEEVNDLLAVQPLPSALELAGVKIRHTPGENFVRVDWRHPIWQEAMVTYVGTGIHFGDFPDSLPAHLHVIGSLDTEKLRESGKLLMEVYLHNEMERVTVILLKDVIRANGQALHEAFSLQGLDTISSGSPKHG